MTSAHFDVSDTVVLVSGGSRGIGLAIAHGFADLGATVIITGRDADTVQQACHGVAHMTCQVCDVANTDDITACVEAVMDRHGHIDTLVNCAGVNTRKPALDYTPEEYDQIMSVNLRGAFFFAQAVGKHMVARGSGNVINIDSLTSHSSLPQVAPYGMSKTGLSHMTRALALEWGQHGVRVNGLAPGFILTDLTSQLWSDPKMQAWNQTITPLRRMGQVEDLVGTAIYLTSPAAGFMTGQTLRVDGGASAGLNWPIDG